MIDFEEPIQIKEDIFANNYDDISKYLFKILLVFNKIYELF